MINLKNFSGVRWRICALLFFATTINYMDRQILGILAPDLQKEIGWTESQYGWITAAFTYTYAFGLLAAGRFLDRTGVKKGFSFAVTGWSFAACAHAFVATPFGFGLARAFLGATEAGNFPSALKASAEWFPKKERALAVGLFNCGSNIGVIAAALLVPFVTLHYSWKAAFIVQGSLGFVWLALWLWYYKSPHEHAGVSPEELRFIQEGRIGEPKNLILPLRKLITYRQTWAFALGKVMTDPVWWFFLFWLPKYLSKEHGVKLGALALPLIVTYVMADVGSIVGGWLSIYFVKRGKSHLEARKLALLCCAILVLPALYLPFVSDMWAAVFLVGLVACAHQGWSANVFSLPGDLFPPATVGSIAGFGHFLGSLSGAIFQVIVGYYLQWSGNNYAPVFVVCALAYICAWFVVKRFMTSAVSPDEFSES